MVTANELMASFAERTGVVGARPQHRYLWTDAFAVSNFIELGQVDRAVALVDRVHHELSSTAIARCAMRCSTRRAPGSRTT